ncbi:hypothetical protein CPB84DRAFT_1745793 [Gymnopilus junonius]|uniref:Ubiquitin-like domain-containing protein n=1 Tax=Gymnopilus junonius TaxID=109634 RepID=A0A9P5TP76_GYMJU|nr:hypothetical protein CPB84DRAFT_1745793 [Gymnopilus junonius]
MNPDVVVNCLPSGKREHMTAEGSDVLRGFVLSNLLKLPIGWGLFKANEVADFRQKLSRHKENITLFLSTLGISLTSNTAEDVRKGLATLALIQATTKEILTVQKQLPQTIGYDIGNAVILKDAFGKSLTLPMDFCFSPDALHNTLMVHFKGKIGQGYIERHEYQISSEDGKSVVKSDPGAWHLSVKKGAVLVMSMEVRRIQLRTNVGVMQDEGWFKCWTGATEFPHEPPLQDLSIVDFCNIQVVGVLLVNNITFSDALAVLVPYSRHFLGIQTDDICECFGAIREHALGTGAPLIILSCFLISRKLMYTNKLIEHWPPL